MRRCGILCFDMEKSQSSAKGECTILTWGKIVVQLYRVRGRPSLLSLVECT